jgi:hypothetical protein
MVQADKVLQADGSFTALDSKQTACTTRLRFGTGADMYLLISSTDISRQPGIFLVDNQLWCCYPGWRPSAIDPLDKGSTLDHKIDLNRC